LKPDTGERAVALLNLVTQQLAAMPNDTRPTLPPSQPFHPPTSALCSNILWLLSLLFSLSAALTATMAKQWIRNYLQIIGRRPAPPLRRARIRAYFHEGLQKFKMPAAIEAIPILLHISLFLFFGGLFEFLLPVNRLISFLISSFFAVAALLYIVVALLPLLCGNWPYHTPFSIVWWCLGLLLRFFLRILKPLLPGWTLEWLNTKFTRVKNAPLAPTTGDMAIEASPKRDARDLKALQWTVRSLRDDSELGPFVEGISLFIGPMNGWANSEGFSRMTKLMADKHLGLGHRIIKHLQTCANLGREQRKRRAEACVTALWPLSCYIPEYMLRESDGEEILLVLDEVSGDPVAMHAKCIAACVMCALGHSLFESRLSKLKDQFSLPSTETHWNELNESLHGSNSIVDSQLMINARFLVLIWIVQTLTTLSICQVAEKPELRLPFGLHKQFIDNSDGLKAPILGLYALTLDGVLHSLPESLVESLVMILPQWYRDQNRGRWDIHTQVVSKMGETVLSSRAKLMARLYKGIRRLFCFPVPEAPSQVIPLPELEVAHSRMDIETQAPTIHHLTTLSTSPPSSDNSIPGTNLSTHHGIHTSQFDPSLIYLSPTPFTLQPQVPPTTTTAVEGAETSLSVPQNGHSVELGTARRYVEPNPIPNSISQSTAQIGTISEGPGCVRPVLSSRSNEKNEHHIAIELHARDNV
jgi:hypothetical protein